MPARRTRCTRIVARIRPRRRRAQGLSAPFRDVHRAGASRARAARRHARPVLAAPPDRRRDPSDPCRDRGAASTICPSTCTRSRCACFAPGAGCARAPGYRAALSAWRADFARDPTRSRARRFGQALVLAAELPGRHRPSARALPAYAGIGRALLRAADRPCLERIGAREGHLDDARLGKARQARGMRVGDDLHAHECRAPARARGGTGACRSRLSRHRRRAVPGTRRAQRARIGVRAIPSPCSRSDAPSTRRASTICSRRWRACPLRCHGGSSTSGGGPLLARLKTQAAVAGHRRSRQLARRAGSAGAARALPERGCLRAGLSRVRGRRSRRLAERADGSAEPEAALRRHDASPASPS